MSVINERKLSRLMLHHSYIMNRRTVFKNVVCCLDHLIKPLSYRYATTTLNYFLTYLVGAGPCRLHSRKAGGMHASLKGDYTVTVRNTRMGVAQE